MDAERRRWAIGSAALLAVLLWPLARGRDGFPLSNYPMFSGERGRVAKIAHVVGRRADGSGSPLPPAMLDTAEIMQASQIARNAAKDAAKAADLCARVAERVAVTAAFDDIVALELRTDEYDVIDYWAEDRRARSGRVHARCGVER